MFEEQAKYQTGGDSSRRSGSGSANASDGKNNNTPAWLNDFPPGFEPLPDKP